MVKFFIEKGVNIEAIDENKDTPLHSGKKFHDKIRTHFLSLINFWGPSSIKIFSVDFKVEV